LFVNALCSTFAANTEHIKKYSNVFFLMNIFCRHKKTHASMNFRILIVIPLYNHFPTLAQVIKRTLEFHNEILIIDDGSTDIPVEIIDSATGALNLSRLSILSKHMVTCIRHAQNLGKGAAIMTGVAEARRLGMTHIVTIDADGQHLPTDLPAFFHAAENDPSAVYVGKRNFSSPHIPCSSRFGRRFSNFWYKVHTAHDIGDVQCGFRLYPLAVFEAIKCAEKRYSFEVEVLVRASWAGFSVRDVPVSVYYPEKAKRISHFKLLKDNILISVLNTRLTVRSILPLPHKKYIQDEYGRISPLHPLRSLRLLLTDAATPKNLALSSAVGMGIGILPLWGLHSILIILFCGAWKLNKIAALAISQLCIPPLAPALCIEIGHFMRYGYFLTEISWQSLGYEAFERLFEWLLGAVILAPLCALLFGMLTFGLARTVKKGMEKSIHNFPNQQRK
jgi:glycosyltransferase involved in cell wall biosynthesis